MNKISAAFFFNKDAIIPLNLREYYISRELLERGHRVVWVHSYKKKSELKNCLGGEFESLSLFKSSNSNVGTITTVIKLCKMLKKKNIRVLWIQGWMERSPLRLLILIGMAKIAGLKVIYDPIDPIYEYTISTFGANIRKINKKWLKFILNISYSMTDIIFAVSDPLKKRLIQSGVSPKKIEIAMWGTDIERFDVKKLPRINPFREEPHLKNKFVIGWLGSMSRFKGIREILLPLINKLTPEHKNLAFLIAGKGELYDTISEFIKTLPENFVNLNGSIQYDQAPAFTAAIDCYIVPTNPKDPLGSSIIPVKVLDSVALGVPVIATKSVAILPISRQIDSIYLTNWDVDSFYEKIKVIQKDYKHYKEISKFAIANVSPFSHQQISKDIVNVLEAKI